MDMRAGDPAALAKGSLNRIEEMLGTGRSVLIDAVMSPVERELYAARFERFVVLAVEAPFELRVRRVQMRTGRRATRAEIFRRDMTERDSLSLDRVILEATLHVRNEKGRRHFHNKLFSLKRYLL
jgi:predicted kinase